MELNDRKLRWHYRHSLKTQANKHYVLCEVARLIYDEMCAYPRDARFEKIREYLVDILMMSKKMSDRLHYYQNKYQDTTGKRGRNIPEFGSRTARRVMRKVREGWTYQI